MNYWAETEASMLYLQVPAVEEKAWALKKDGIGGGSPYCHGILIGGAWEQLPLVWEDKDPQPFSSEEAYLFFPFFFFFFETIVQSFSVIFLF